MNSVVIAMVVFMGGGFIAMAIVALVVARRPAKVLLSVLFFTAVVWTGEAWARPEDTGSNESRSPRVRTYQAPLDRAPEVLCGCIEVLKNFA